MTTIALPVNQLVVSGEKSASEPVDYTKLNDKKLAEMAIQHEDMQAFEQLYLRHHRRVYSLCLRMLQNTAQAEDLSQDVFIVVFRKLKSFRGDSAFTTWLHRVTVNQVLMHYRKRHVKYEIFESNLSGCEKLLMESESSSSVPIDKNLILSAALTQLPDGYKRTFVLHDILGYEHQDVADIMGVSIGTSKSQLHKARLKLRKLVDKRVNPKTHHRRTDE